MNESSLMNLKVADISQTSSASTLIFNVMRKAIIEGDIPGDTPLRQNELAKMFNTSRIPVREAISKLEEQGFVKSQRFKSAVVVGLSKREAEEIFDLRALLEPEILRKSVPTMSNELKKLAREHCNAFSNSTKPMEWGDLNRVFHKTLYGESKQYYFIQVLDNAMDKADRYIRAQLLMSDGMPQAETEHFAILQACERGDADLAALLLKEHIIGAKESLLKFFP